MAQLAWPARFTLSISNCQELISEIGVKPLERFLKSLLVSNPVNWHIFKAKGFPSPGWKVELESAVGR